MVQAPEPRPPRPRDVLLRPLEVGICGTDREIAEFKYGSPPADSDYLILGHEALAQVVEPGGSRFRAGELVVPMVRRPCPHEYCCPCRSGRQDYCVTGDFTECGIKGAQGFMADLAVAPEEYLVRVPPELREVAVLTEPLTIAEKAMREVRNIQDRLSPSCRHFGSPNAVVFGAGPVGLLGAMLLLQEGYTTWVYSRGSEQSAKAGLAVALGATFVSSDRETPAQLAGRIGNIDVVYEATGASAPAFALLEVLGVNGIFVFTGIPGRKEPAPVPTGEIMRRLVLRNQVVFGTVNAGRWAYEHALADLEEFLIRRPEATHKMITSRLPIESFEQAIRDTSGIKTVVQFSKD
jgi:threonine dehydrogenase-like Zn-dependent dehydrogenase